MFLNSIYNERYDSIAIFEIKGYLRLFEVARCQGNMVNKTYTYIENIPPHFFHLFYIFSPFFFSLFSNCLVNYFFPIILPPFFPF